MSPHRIAAVSLLAGLLAACGPSNAPTTPTTPGNTTPAFAVASVDASALGSVRAIAFVTMTSDGMTAGKLDPEASHDGADLDTLSGKPVTHDDLTTELHVLLDDAPADTGGLLGHEVAEIEGGFGFGTTGATCAIAFHRADPETDTVLLVPEATVAAAEVAVVLSTLPYAVALVAHAEDPARGRPLAMVADSSASRAESTAVLVIGAGTARLSLDDGATALWSGTGAAAIAEAVRGESAARPELLVQVSIRLEVDATAQDLITAVAGLGAASVEEILLLDAPGSCGWGTIGVAGTEAPSVGVGQPQVNGELDKAIIRRYIKASLTRITYCYEKQLLITPTLEGTATSKFTIDPTGLVSSAEVTGLDPDVDACIKRVLLGIEFPKPAGGGSVHVTYPFTFRLSSEP